MTNEELECDKWIAALIYRGLTRLNSAPTQSLRALRAV